MAEMGDGEIAGGQDASASLVSYATNVVEHLELVCEPIIRLESFVGGENVIASTDCGFSQGPFTRHVHPSIMWAKLSPWSRGRGWRRVSCGSGENWMKGPRSLPSLVPA